MQEICTGWLKKRGTGGFHLLYTAGREPLMAHGSLLSDVTRILLVILASHCTRNQAIRF